MWECLNNLGKALISSGYGLALILVGGVVFGTWAIFGGMKSSDKKDALLAILSWPIFGIAGWIVAIVTIIVAKRLITFQTTSYEVQISEIRKTKEEALSIQERLPLGKSNRNNQESNS